MKTIDLTVGEAVVLPHGVVLTFVRRKGEKAVLGLLAPKAVRIDRPEAKSHETKAGRRDPWELSRGPVR